jgi:hypothetical protein
MAVQLIKDDNGKTQYVVIPYDEYFRMCLQMAESTTKLMRIWRISKSNTIV